jgi:hypothetical protein
MYSTSTPRLVGCRPKRKSERGRLPCSVTRPHRELGHASVARGRKREGAGERLPLHLELRPAGARALEPVRQNVDGAPAVPVVRVLRAGRRRAGTAPQHRRQKLPPAPHVATGLHPNFPPKNKLPTIPTKKNPLQSLYPRLLSLEHTRLILHGPCAQTAPTCIRNGAHL